MKTLIIIAIITISAIMILAITHYAHASCATSDVPCNDLISNPTAQTPHLATIHVLFNTTHNSVAITGTIHKLFSNLIVLKIQNPQGNLVEVSQIQPASDGTFSLTVAPLASIWSLQGNYTVTASSGSQEIGNTIFYYNGTSHTAPTLQYQGIKASPLKQFKSGISARDIICVGDLQLVIKTEDDSPACVNSYTALRLAQIGWTESNGSEMQQLPDPSSALKLNLSVNPVLVHPKEVVGIKISVNNTFSNPIYVVVQNQWAYENLDSPCKKIRLGIAILDGYYTTSNMTEGKNLQLFNKYDCLSLNLESGKVYEFQAQSDQVKEITCFYYFGEPCHSEGLNMNYGFDGYWDENNTKQPFKAGTYTVIGADEWGHVAIQHFTVVNSDLANNQNNESDEFDGVIIDQSFSAEHVYYFFTNDTSMKFNTGSTGIRLEGLDSINFLNGKHVKISGTIPTHLQGEDVIKVENFQILGSFVPKGTTPKNVTQKVSFDDLFSNPDRYYNQTITITGQLRELDYQLGFAGVGCSSAEFTTSDEFVPDFISRHQLYDGERYIGARIGGQDDVGYSESEKLPMDLKNKQVTITGIFVPSIKDTGQCMHILHKSGYILTDFTKISATGN